MGWSCSKAASDTMQRWERACVAQTQSSNTYRASIGGIERECFFEHSTREHADGSITGSAYQIDSAGMAHSMGPWRINGDGTVNAYPRGLKDVPGVHVAKPEPWRCPNGACQMVNMAKHDVCAACGTRKAAT